MHTKKKIRRSAAFLLLLLGVILSLSCGILVGGEPTGDLEATLEQHGTWIAYLATQVRGQGEAIEYLSTQMPLALGRVTPTPPGERVTPTAYTPAAQPGGDTSTPTLDPNQVLEYPPETRTGIAEIDRVIEAFRGQDIQRRLDLVRYTRTACGTVEALGGPPECLPGEAQGTLVEVFPVSSGEGFYVRPEDMPDTLGFPVSGLFAVYRVPADAYQSENWPAGEYGVVFTLDDPEYPYVLTLIVKEGRILRLDYNLGSPSSEIIRQRSEDFILPPLD